MKISIKRKFTIFIILLLIFNLLIISTLTLRGIEDNQRVSYETFLKDNSKTANLFIRQKFYLSKYENFEYFYIDSARELSIELGSLLNINTILYDKNGKLIGSSDKVINDKNEYTEIIMKALDNNIVYQQIGDTIVYAAPVYDFNDQIGVLKIEYNVKKQRVFYEDIKELFIKVGIVSIIIALLAASLYFWCFVKKIIQLKKSVKFVEDGNYDAVSIINTNDELGELSKGIVAMSNKIQDNIEEINIEKSKLQAALEKLQKLEKKQKEFIGNITHEFKTPITVIKAQLDLITLYDDDEDMVDRSKEIADKELKRLDNMIENILYLSSMEKYDFELKKERIDSQVLLTEIIERMSGKASKFGIQIIYDIIPVEIYIDRDSFMQIFINLIDNAIKYNKNNGKIIIKSYIKDEKNIIEIEDTGIGIPDEHKSRIFEPFYTVDKNRSKNFSGTGLGLSLVYKLLKKQDSDIKVKDSIKGTIFQVSIPLYK